DGGEILGSVVGQIGYDPRRHRMGRRIREDGVAIGLGLDDRADAKRAAGAAAVLHDDRLAEHGRERIDNRARDHVGRTAGAEREERLDGPIGPLIGEGRRGPPDQSRNQDTVPFSRHASLPLNSRDGAAKFYAAFIPCRLWEASFTVKNTTSPSAVAFPPCTTLDGI